MKNLFIALLLLAAVVSAGVAFQKQQRLAEAAREASELRDQIQKLEARLAVHQKQANSLQNRLQDTRSRLQETHVEAATKATEVVQLQQALTNKTKDNPMAEMFKDPEMKDLIKSQQKMVLGGMIEKSYTPLFSKYQMTPEQSAALKDMITKKMMVDAEIGMALMGGGADAAKREELMKQAKEQKDAIDAEIRQYLGDSNYSDFQAYEKTLPDRMSIGMFKDQLASGPSALSGELEETLVQILSEERMKFKFTTDYNDQSKLTGDMASYFTEEKIATFGRELDQLQQIYLQRVQPVLNPDQYSAFEKFVVAQRQMQEAGMKMAGKMFRK